MEIFFSENTKKNKRIKVEVIIWINREEEQCKIIIDYIAMLKSFYRTNVLIGGLLDEARKFEAQLDAINIKYGFKCKRPPIREVFY